MTGTVTAGASLTIDGPPQAEFYPVTVNGQAGWVHGATLEILKDAVAATDVAAAPPATGEAAPVAAYDTQTAAQEVPADNQAPPTGDQAPPAGQPPPEQAPPTDAGAPPADPAASADPNAQTNQAAPDGQAAVGGEAPPAEASAAPDPATAGTDPAAQANPPADPVATVVATDAAANGQPPADPAAANGAPPADQNAASAPAVTPVPSPVAVQTPEPAPTGQASVPGGANLFQEPNSSSYVVFWVPAGSTVWRFGEARNGFVHVDYMAMAGWVEAGTLTEPVPVTAETIPDAAPTAENVRTPRPGSGVAFTTVELSLRSGPSGAEAELAVVPAGTRVIMTGVMENGFHRVDYRGTLGWLASDYLSTPPDPTATPEPTADTNNNNNSNSSRYQRTYTRDEIVKIIYAAADRYGQSRSDMLRVAECESALDPYAVHPSGSYGLFQFIRSTWKTTPYGDQDVFDPKANSNAAAWMWSQGRQSEWVCK